MKKWTIGVEKQAQELCDCLSEACAELAKQGVTLVGEQSTRGKYTFYTYRLVGTIVGQADSLAKRAMQALAEGVSAFITDVWEREELGRIVTSDFYYYAADEVDYLSDCAVKMLAELKGADGRPLRSSHIVDQVKEQLAMGQELVIEGLLRFRMQPLYEDLHRVIEQAIDEYLMDLEYQEFVKLLRYFLDVQEPGMPLLHMVCVNEAENHLFNAEGKPLQAEDLEGIIAQGLNQLGIQVEDLMSVLIGLAPERLLVHVVGTPDDPLPLVETVQKIFQDKATVCTGCPLCHCAEQWGDIPSVSEQHGK